MNLLESFDFYPFGLLMPMRTSTTGNTIEKFTGKELDSDLNLYYFGARYYDPAINRWWSVDPLAQEYPSLSSYNYAANNPLFYVDPNGMALLDWVKDLETDKYVWDWSVSSAKDTPEGFAYIGKSLDDVKADFEASTSWVERLFSDPKTDFNGHSEITQFDESNLNVFGKIKSQIGSSPFPLNLVGGAAYDLADAAYVSVLSLQRGNSRINLAGEVVTGSRITESGIKTLIGFFPYSRLLRIPGLNAAQFSRAFRGTFINRLQPATRGTVNRTFNRYLYTKQTEYLMKGAYLSSEPINNN